MGCGKSTLVRKYPDRFIDVDTILNSIASEHGIIIDDEQKTGLILKSKFKAGLLPLYWDIIKETSNKTKEYSTHINVLGGNFFIPGIADILYIYPNHIKRQRFYKTCLERGKAPRFDSLIAQEAFWQRRKPFKYIEEEKYLSDYLMSV